MLVLLVVGSCSTTPPASPLDCIFTPSSACPAGYAPIAPRLLLVGGRVCPVQPRPPRELGPAFTLVRIFIGWSCSCGADRRRASPPRTSSPQLEAQSSILLARSCIVNMISIANALISTSYMCTRNRVHPRLDYPTCCLASATRMDLHQGADQRNPHAATVKADFERARKLPGGRVQKAIGDRIAARLGP